MGEHTQEEWRWVPGRVGYEVSSLGRVRSWRSHGKAPGLASKPTLLKPTATPLGYLYVTLAGPREKQYVHRLVAAAFLGPGADGMQVAHGDGDPGNNAPANLRWATATENQSDKIAHGRTNRGERSANRKLTAQQVAEIRERYGPPVWGRNGRESQRALAAEFGVSQQRISSIVWRQTWAHAA